MSLSLHLQAPFRPLSVCIDILVRIITTCATRKVWRLSALNYSARFLFDSRQFEAQAELTWLTWNVRRQEGSAQKLKC